MMVPKAKLEISRGSTIVIKEVFTKSPKIRRTDHLNLLCQSGSEVTELTPRARRGRQATGRDIRVESTRRRLPQNGKTLTMVQTLASITNTTF